MVTSKKAKKMRGSKTHGYGSKKKHRGAGSRGGRGLAGSSGHRKLYVLKNIPKKDKGFKRKNKKIVKTINIGDLKRFDKKADLDKEGYDKLIGKGNITKPLNVRIKRFSKKAKEKIEEAGGKIELP